MIPPSNEIDMIAIADLEDGAQYKGYCATGRGPNIMFWDGKKEKFKYNRYKFGWRVDEMHHELDPNRPSFIEGFMPLENADEA